jgi:TPR repeat protein
MKTTFTLLMLLLCILFSCKTDEEQSNETDAINLENLSINELEDKGFKHIEDPETFEVGIKYLDAAAFKGSGKAAQELGLRYAYGNGVKKDYWLAKTYLKKAAFNEVTQFTLGRIIFENATSELDYKEAYECFNRATYGEYDNYSEYMLGYMNYYGLGTLKNYKIAYEYFDASTKRPDSDTLYGADLLGLGDAKYFLGMMALDGHGCQKNYSIAESHFSLGIMSNACKYMLGVMHYNGLCKRSSKKLAAFFIKQVYEIDGLNGLDQEFSTKARQFWEDKELWRYHEESTNNGFNGLFN